MLYFIFVRQATNKKVLLFYWFCVILKSNRFGKRGITVRLTISDIAKKTGYAKSTVSAALNNKPGVKPKTREEIQRIAADYEYHRDHCVGYHQSFLR